MLPILFSYFLPELLLPEVDVAEPDLFEDLDPEREALPEPDFPPPLPAAE